jgi:hypothetical protein
MKSKIHYRSFLSLVAFVAGAPLVFAQTTSSPEAAPEAAVAAPVPLPEAVKVSTKLDIISWAETISGLRLKEGGGGKDFTAKAFEYSEPIAYTGSSILEILQTTQPGNAGASVPKGPVIAKDPKVPLTELEKRRLENPSIVALASLPAGSTRATVLMAPATGGTYNTFVIDDDLAKLPLGKVRFHNYCKFPVAFRCHGKVFKELKPKETAIFEPINGQIFYRLYYWMGGEWVLQNSNSVEASDTEQVQLVALQSEAAFFTSSDGSRAGFVQTVTLRRKKSL